MLDVASSSFSPAPSQWQCLNCGYVHDGRMVGAILLGDTAFSGNLKHAIESGRDFWALLKARASIADVLESLA